MINGTIYFWEHKGDASNHELAGYVGGYSTRNLSLGLAANEDVTGTAGLGGETYTAPGLFIPHSQGFFVSGNANGLITFDNTQRAGQIVDGENSVFFRTGNDPSQVNQSAVTGFPQFKIGFESENSEGRIIHRQLGVAFKATSTLAFDNGYDSALFDLQNSDAYFKFPNDDIKYNISSIGAYDKDLEFPLVVHLEEEGSINFTLDEFHNFRDDFEIYLLDKLTDTYTNLEKETFTTTLSAGDYENRFYIVFKNAQSALSNDDVLLDNYQIYTNQNDLIIKLNNFEINNLKIYNILGQVVLEKNDVSNMEMSVPIGQLDQGIYIVKVNTEKGLINKKIILP